MLFQELSNYIMEKVKPLKNSEKYMRIWGNSIICDTIVNSVLQNIDTIESVFDVADEAIEIVMTEEIEPSANDFFKRFKVLDTNPPIKVHQKAPYFASFNYDTPSFKSVFMGGLGGSGKSMILAYTAMYAFKNNWILINIPNAKKWTQDRTAKPVKMFNGLFVVE
jgi:hypothetical protein